MKLKQLVLALGSVGAFSLGVANADNWESLNSNTPSSSVSAIESSIQGKVDAYNYVAPSSSYYVGGETDADYSSAPALPDAHVDDRYNILASDIAKVNDRVTEVDNRVTTVDNRVTTVNNDLQTTKSNVETQKAVLQAISNWDGGSTTSTAKVDAIGSGAVGSDQLASSAVTNAKIAADAITSTKIAAGAVQSSDLHTDAVSLSNLTLGSGTEGDTCSPDGSMAKTSSGELLVCQSGLWEGVSKIQYNNPLTYYSSNTILGITTEDINNNSWRNFTFGDLGTALNYTGENIGPIYLRFHWNTNACDPSGSVYIKFYKNGSEIYSSPKIHDNGMSGTVSFTLNHGDYAHGTWYAGTNGCRPHEWGEGSPRVMGVSSNIDRYIGTQRLDSVPLFGRILQQ